MHLLQVLSIGTTTYHYNTNSRQPCQELEFLWQETTLRTVCDTWRRNCIGRTHIVDNRTGQNVLMIFLQENPRISSQMAQNLTPIRGVYQWKKLFKWSRRSTANCQNRTFTRYSKIQAEIFMPTRQHFI